MSITGEAIIGGVQERGAAGSFKAWDPARRDYLEPSFHMVTPDQIDRACRLAGEAFDSFRATSDQERARFLDTVAEQILAIGDELIERAMAESGLPRVRLEGERMRTVNQLRMFASLLREGSWADARLDTPLPERAPPRPDLRMRMIGLGPVAVFAASNFPLAFSVAGGDTASAFAAGCPVVLKAHSAHPGTSELVARAVAKAVQLCELPAGVFALLTGTGNGIGQALVGHPAIQAVGFTGSRSGGTALMAVAAALFRVSAEEFLKRHELHEEVFGPASVLVVCQDADQLREVAEVLEGQLTATLQIDAEDYAAAKALLPVLERKVGRILANGYPTGVEVSTAMVHGGPFPSTADGRSTSVGTGAIGRFLRPVCYQNMPAELLPEVLRDGNPLGTWRRRDGALTKE